MQFPTGVCVNIHMHVTCEAELSGVALPALIYKFKAPRNLSLASNGLLPSVWLLESEGPCDATRHGGTDV